MLYNKAVVAIFCFCLTHAAFAQPETLHRDVKDQLEQPVVGPNSFYYNYSVVSFGSVVPFEPADTLVDKPGFTISSTSHYKWKMTPWYSLGIDLRYAFASIPLVEDSVSNPFYPLGGFEKQNFRNHRFDLGGFMRFNFDKRGNYLGKFLDVGGFAGFNFSQRIRTKIETDPKLAGGVKAVKTVASKLQFTEKFAYGVEARLGLNKLEFSFRYRLSDLFRAGDGRFEAVDGQPAIIPDLPRLTVSVGIALPSDTDL